MNTMLPERRLIPRWRRTSQTLEMNEASSFAKGTQHIILADASDFEDTVERWRKTSNVGYLGDVLSFSVVPEFRERLKVIAREVIDKSVQTTNTQVAIVNSILGGSEEDIPQQEAFSVCNPVTQREVQLLRRMLRINPSNPLALLDIAQLQLTSGKHRDAQRSLLSAISLSPNNRLVIRTLSRFYVHIKQPDRAHHLIRRHPRTAEDPWLMASEVALAAIANVPPHFAKRGFKFVRDRSAANPDISELAGALGGIELGAGNAHRARELFRVALLEPNDNVIAQAVTNQRALGIDLSDPVRSRTSLSAAEVQTLLAWDAMDTKVAESSAISWHLEEPFSSRPLQFLATLYAIENEFGKGINLAKRGLMADPDDSTLLANLAYLLAIDGRLNDSEAILRRLSKDKSERFVAITLATNGLIAMKRALYELGDKLYLEAIDKFRHQNDSQFLTTCYAYYARSAVNASHPNSNQIVASAVDQYNKQMCIDAAIILRKLGKDVPVTEQTKSARRLSQWIFDEKHNILVQHRRLTKPGEAPLMVIK